MSSTTSSEQSSSSSSSTLVSASASSSLNGTATSSGPGFSFTPFSTPPASEFTPVPPTVGNSSGGGNSSSTGSATLYLYTFLATLVLLLGVSSAIVSRSLVLRRRHRRMVEEAVRNGTWIPSPTGRLPRFDPANKPKMHEVYLGGDGSYDDAGGDLAWSNVMPLYANYSIDTPTSITSPEPRAASTQSHPTVRLNPLPTSRFMNMFRRRASPPTSPPVISVAPSAERIPSSAMMTPSEPDKVRVGVIIVMPSQAPNTSSSPSTSTSTQEEELPELQVGVANVKLVRHRSSEDSDDCLGGTGGVQDKGEGVSGANSLDMSDVDEH